MGNCCQSAEAATLAGATELDTKQLDIATEPEKPSSEEPVQFTKIEHTAAVDQAPAVGGSRLPPITESPEQSASREQIPTAEDSSKLPDRKPANSLITHADISQGVVPEEVSFLDQQWDNYSSGEMSGKEKEFFADKTTAQPRRPSTTDIKFSEYAKKNDAVFSKLRELESNDGWTFKKTVDGVDIYTKTVPGEDMVYTKGFCTMKTHGNGIRHLVANMLVAEDRPKYDVMCAFGQTVESFLPFYRIIQFQMVSPAVIIAPRDVVTLSRILFEEDGSLLIATESIAHPLAPEKPPHIRCEISGGYLIRPTSDPDTYKIIFAVKSDPKGWLPGWVKTLVAWKVQLVLAAFKAYYDKTYGK